MADGAFAQVQRRASLYEQKTQSSKQVYSRVVLVSRLPDGGADEAGRRRLGDALQDAMSSLADARPWLRIVGLSLLYPRVCVHAVEAPPEILVAALEAIQHQRAAKRLGTTRVLVCSDTLAPSFASFDYKLVDLSSNAGEYKPEIPVETVAGECVFSMMRIGEFLSTRKTGYSEALAELTELAGELLCSQAMLEWLARSRDLEKLAGFIERVRSSLDIVLDGDVCWPIPERLYPYD